MDTLEEIAISKIADILSSTNLIVPQVDIWKRIFNNAGLSELYEDRSPQFTTMVESYGYGPGDKNLYHNEKCYNGLHESFKELEYDKGALLKLFNSITEKMSIFNIFIEDVEKKIKKEIPRIKGSFIDEYLNQIDLSQRNIFLNKYGSKNFKLLRNNFNILALDVCFDEKGLCILPFTGSITENAFDNTVLMQWLSSKYPNIAISYTDAIKAFSNDDETACISHCRNIITGITSYKKDEQRKWMDGLQKICYKDKNIMNVQANKIGEYNYNANSPDVNARYQYPRYNLIYKLYSFTCALGAHINEGNLSDATVDFEEVTLEDAFLALKTTEAFLIWIYQTNAL